ncbi:MAG: hypothetical protein GWN58_35050 [Anaerolineae bacterium]|nr:hypothetical protein [Anaerolineae bacterium]
MSATSQTSSRPPSSPGVLQWLKKNLFSTWYNSLLTILSLVVIYFVVKGILTWVFTVADWSPVFESLKLFATGLYPVEEVWRIGTILAMVSFLAGLSWGVWGGTVRTFAIGIAAGFAVIAFLPFDLYPPNDDPLDLMLRAGIPGPPGPHRGGAPDRSHTLHNRSPGPGSLAHLLCPDHDPAGRIRG